jgi:hypothetical protein
MMVWFGARDGGAATDIADGNSSGQRASAGPYSAAVVARLHDPLAIFLADDAADVMRPDHHSTDMGRCGSANPRPITRYPKFAAFPPTDAKFVGHFSATPR